MPILSWQGEGNIVGAAIGKALADAAESKTLCMRGHPKRENREILLVSVLQCGDVTSVRNSRKTFPTEQLI